MPGARRTTKAVDVSVPLDPLGAALTCNINYSAGVEHRPHQHRRKEWLAQNAEGVEAYNRYVEEHGSFGDTLRSF